MSLLNEALRNVEQRQQSPEMASAYIGQSQLTKSRRKAPWVMLGVLGVIATSMAFGYWLSGAKASPEPEVSNAEMIRAPESVAANLPPSVQETEAVVESSVPALPADDEVLAVSNEANAPVLSDEAAPVKEAESQSGRSRIEAPSVEPTATVAKPEVPVQTVQESDGPEAPANNMAKAAESEQPATSSEPVAAAEVRTTHATPASKDRAAAVAIRDALANGRIDEARQALAGIVETQNAPRSRAQWVRHLLVTGDIHEALAWAPADIAAENTDLRLLRARAQHALGDVDAALATLESQAPAVEAAPNYAVTLATLLQQAGRYGPAASRWAELIAYDDARGAWWVGLAIALESEQRLESAARAYAQALELPDLSASLRDYILQRLRAFEVDGTNG